MSNTQEPQPAGFEFEVSGMKLIVSDVTNYLWHGSYYEGKLTIYAATSTGNPLVPDTAAYVAIYVRDGAPDDFLTFSLYDKTDSNDVVINDIREKVFAQYCSVKQYQAVSSAPESKTIH